MSVLSWLWGKSEAKSERKHSKRGCQLFGALPGPLLRRLLAAIDHTSLLCLARCCTELRKVVIDDNLLWSRLLVRDLKRTQTDIDKIGSKPGAALANYRMLLDTIILSTRRKATKAIVLGCSGVGKTSVLRRFAGHLPYEDFRSSIGIDFYVTTRTVGKGSRSMKVQLWDTAGQERFWSFGRGYWRGADIVFFVFSLYDRESMDEMVRWFQQFQKWKGQDATLNPVVVVLGNKLDLRDWCEQGSNQPVSTEEGRKAAAECGASLYFEVSARTEQNLETALMGTLTAVDEWQRLHWPTMELLRDRKRASDEKSQSSCVVC